MMFLFMAALFMSATIAIGAEATTADTSQEFISLLFASMNGAKGAGVFGAAAVTVQLLIKLLNLPFTDKFFAKQKGITKLGIVAGLTFAVTPLGLITAAGLPLGAALMHTTTLTAFSVFANQIFSQTKNAKKPALVPVEEKQTFESQR